MESQHWGTQDRRISEATPPTQIDEFQDNERTHLKQTNKERRDVPPQVPTNRTCAYKYTRKELHLIK